MGSRGADFKSEEEPQTTVYIGNLPSDSIQGDVEHIFSSCKIRSIRMVRDRETDVFRGFAYVEFEDTASVKTALELNGAIYDGKELKIDVAQNRNRNTGFRGGRGGGGPPSSSTRGGGGGHRGGGGSYGGGPGGGGSYGVGGGGRCYPMEFVRGGGRGGGGPSGYQHQGYPEQGGHHGGGYGGGGYGSNGRGGGGGRGPSNAGGGAFHSGGGRRQRQGSSGGGGGYHQQAKSEPPPPPPPPQPLEQPPVAGRPKLKLLPRSVPEPVNAAPAESASRNTSIFGSGRPRPPTPPSASQPTPPADQPQTEA